MNITDEMLSAATRALHDVDCDPECGESLTTMGRYGRQAKAMLEAAAPLIAAQALRQAAEFVRDDESDGSFSHGDRCSYGPPGQCDCERGITYRWLMSRSRGLCGAPNWHKAGYACGREAGHQPDYDHRFGPVAP
jgi:hypothetical protein